MIRFNLEFTWQCSFSLLLFHQNRCSLKIHLSFLVLVKDYVKMPLEYEYFGSRILDVILNDSDRFVLKSKLEINRLNAPIYEVPLDEVCVGAVLWPVVIIQQGDLLACSVPLIDRKIGEILIFGRFQLFFSYLLTKNDRLYSYISLIRY